ncbi:Imm32 family immunity protein [Kitasatospora sp. HPMI-4]|uniref:Imm32 family immunity protein n=1 Tax=Kitasatospora sp. HPMI-4 TaxID=3448443 RepID=UPI003F1A4E79
MNHEADRPSGARGRVDVTTDGVVRTFGWEADARIMVRQLGGETVIEADAAGLRALAGHLLVLAQDGTPDGSHLHLEAGTGLVAGSSGLVLERDETPGP